MENRNSNLTVNRRSLLRSASGAGVVLGGFSQTVSAQETSTENVVKFAELKLTHDVSPPEEPQLHYPTWTVNDFNISHFADHTRSKLYLNENRDRGIDIPNQDAVVANDGYSPLPADLGGSSPSMITTELHESFRGKSALSVKNREYMQPEISAGYTQNRLSITAEGHEATVPVGKEDNLALPKRDIIVEAFEFADEAPPERDDHRRAAPVRNYREVKLTITPVIRVRNYGNLNISKVTARSPVPNPTDFLR